MQRNREKGVIIIFVVIIVGIIGLLYASIYFLISSERKMQKTVENRAKAYYIAEAGLEKAYVEIRNKKEANIRESFPLSSDDKPFATVYNGKPIYNEKHSATITITKNHPSYTIVCEGKYGNSVRRLEASVVKLTDELEIQYWKEIN